MIRDAFVLLLSVTRSARILVQRFTDTAKPEHEHVLELIHSSVIVPEIELHGGDGVPVDARGVDEHSVQRPYVNLTTGTLT